MNVNKDMLTRALDESGSPQSDSPSSFADGNRPRIRPQELPGSGKIGAVVLLVYENKLSGPSVVLTKRETKLSRHADQISLPGGRQDEGESLRETAIREAVEEIGVESHRIDIMGRLNSVYIPPSDFTIHPFVGWYDGYARFVKSEFEVKEIIELSIKDLCRADAIKFGAIEELEGADQRSYYDVSGHQVWGATAVVLCDFARLIAPCLE